MKTRLVVGFVHREGTVRRATLLIVFSVVAAGCEGKRETNLEQRVKQLEERTRQLEAERTKSSEDDAARREKLEGCLLEADTEFDTYRTRNGKKQADGSYNVPVPVIEQMQRQRESKIERCKLLYSN
jgi:hypothetical protein